MTKDEFLSAVAVIQAHDDRQTRVDNYLREDDAEHGCGMFTYLPDISVHVRRLAIDLLAHVNGLDTKDSVIAYYFDECRTMKDGGAMTYPDGVRIPIRNPEDLWLAVCHETREAA